MSGRHGLKSVNRHPDPQGFARVRFPVEHVTFEVAVNGDLTGGSFALIAGEAAHAKDRRAMFTGLIGPNMADELRMLAAELDPLCFALRKALNKSKAGAS
jgi:hypothetical protein